MGVSVSTPTPRERREAGLSEDVGVRVESVDRGSPASGVLRADDFIVKLNDRAAIDSDWFVRSVGTTNTDHPADLLIQRDGKPKTVSIALAKRPPAVAAVTRQSRRIRWEGLLLGPTPKNWKAGEKDSAEAEHGLVVLAVSAKSRYAKQGVQEGDVITAIAGKALADVTDLQQVLNDLPPTQRELKFATHKSTASATASARD
jgi:S1-C subfamily serine protease